MCHLLYIHPANRRDRQITTQQQLDVWSDSTAVLIAYQN